MENIKILHLVLRLSDIQMENVLFLLKSRLANRKNEIILLTESIIRLKNKSGKSNLWNSVFPAEKLNEQKFRKLCFEALQEVEICIAVYEMMQNQDNLQFHLANFYLENDMDAIFETKNEKNRRKVISGSKLGTEAYLFNYQLEHQYFLFLQKQENEQRSLNIAASAEGLDKFYFSQKLKYICNTINYRAILGKTEQIAFEEDIIRLIKYSALKEDALISIYYTLYFLLKNPENEEHFRLAKQMLNEKAMNIEKNEFSDMIQYLINYCIKKINQSSELYLAELFDIYLLYLKKSEDKVFSPIRFKNIFLLALKMKKFEWAENFLENYGHKLPKEQKETTIAYNRARLYYDTKQYDKVLDTLLNLHHEEVQFNLISKVLIVKTFYEKNEIQFLENYMLSFKAYILRNKEMNIQNKQIHLNFLKVMKKLIVMEYRSKKEIDKFITKVEDYPNLPDRSWFLEKLNKS